MIYVWTRFFSQVRLDKIQEDIKIYLRRTSDFDEGQLVTTLLLTRRSIEILLNKDPMELETGSHVLLEEFVDSLKEEEFDFALGNMHQGQVYYALGLHHRSTELALDSGIFLERMLSCSANMPSIYQQSFSLYVSAQQAKKWRKRRKYRRLAKKRHGILRLWAKDGCPNVIHYIAILDAENAILDRSDQNVVEVLYQKAIVLAARSGMVLDAAVANERLAKYYERLGDTIEAGRRFEQAIQYYDDYGLESKANMLRQRFGDYISSWSMRREEPIRALVCGEA